MALCLTDENLPSIKDCTESQKLEVVSGLQLFYGARFCFSVALMSHKRDAEDAQVFPSFRLCLVFWFGTQNGISQFWDQ